MHHRSTYSRRWALVLHRCCRRHPHFAGGVVWWLSGDDF